MVCANNKQKYLMLSSVRFSDLLKKTNLSKTLGQVRLDHNSKLGVNKLEMVSSFSSRIFRLEILDYLSRRLVYFENFPLVQANMVLPFAF